MINKLKEQALNLFTSWTRTLNELTLDQARHTFLYFRNLLWIAPTIVWVLCLAQIFLPLGTLSFNLFTFFCWVILAVSIVGSSFVNWFLILLTTRRTDKSQDERVDLMWGELARGLWQSSYIFGASLALPLSMTIVPFLQYLRLHQSVKTMTPQAIDHAIGSPIFIRLVIIGIAVVTTVYLHSRLSHTVDLYEKRIRSWMSDYQFHYQPLRQMLSGMTEEEIRAKKHEPTMILGYSIETGDLVVQSVEARKRNSMVLGPIGAGKSSTWFRPQIVQDILHFIYYMRDYARVSEDENWDKPYGLQPTYLNGFAVVETTNDLCKTVYNDAIAMGVPKEKIVWLDPDNPNTPSLNLLSGPINKVAQNVTEVLTGLKQSNNDFFSQAERTFLMQHVYLLKYAEVIEGKPANFSELVKMLSDPHLTVAKMKKLEAYVEIAELDKENAQKALNEKPDDEDLSSKYKNLVNAHSIALETLGWFQNNIYAEQFKTGVKVEQSGPYKGQPKYVNKQEQYVGGLINTVTDLSKEVGVRRVLFAQNSDFNLDEFMKNGGILLCNTAKDNLGATLAHILGQIYTLSIQSATFRRRPNVDPMFALYMDEFPDYLSNQFPAFAAQARKYNVPINIGGQSPAQLSREYGPDYLRTIMSVMLTRATFGDMGAEDAKQLEPLFGEHEEAVESIDDQDIDLAADQAQNRRRINTRVEMVPNITAAEIMGMEKFTMAIRTPGDTRSNVYDHIKTHLITDESVADNPENFDIDDEDDRKAYDAMEAKLDHDNHDFSETDKLIMAQLESGEYVIQWPTEEELNTGDDILPTILDSNGEVLSGSDDQSNGVNASDDVERADDGEDTGESRVTKVSKKRKDYSSEQPPGSVGVVDDYPTEFDDNNDALDQGESLGGEIDPGLSHVGKSKVSKVSNKSDDDFDDLLSTDDNDSDSSTEETEATTAQTKDGYDPGLAALDASVKKSPNGGNNRFDNNLKTADSVQDNQSDSETNQDASSSSVVKKVGKVTKVGKPDKPVAPQKQVEDEGAKDGSATDSSDQKDLQNSTLVDEQSKENKNKEDEDKDMLFVDDNNQLVDKPATTQRPIAGRQQDTIKELKKSALTDMQNGFNNILTNPELTEAQKLSEMKIFRDDQRQKLKNIFPNNIDKVIDRIDQGIIKQQEKVDSLHVELDGDDSIESANRKFKENDDAHGDELSKDLSDMLDQYNNDSDPFDYEEDTPFNDKDPFNNQPGMQDPFDQNYDSDNSEEK